MIVIVDYGMGNLRSVFNAFGRLGVAVAVSDRAETIAAADKIVLPGVGAFGDAMMKLRKRDIAEVLDDAALRSRKPTLGICLGMQLLARRSAEGDAEGLGWLAADVLRMESTDPQARIPHIGWNDVIIDHPGRLLEGLGDQPTAYFVHGYHMVPDDPGIICARTKHGGEWAAVVEQSNLFGAQFHPEKSHDVGLKILANFAAL